MVKDLTSPIKDNGGMVNEDSSILIILQEWTKNNWKLICFYTKYWLFVKKVGVREKFNFRVSIYLIASIFYVERLYITISMFFCGYEAIGYPNLEFVIS